MCCQGLWFVHSGSKGFNGPAWALRSQCGPRGMPYFSGQCAWGT